MNITRDQLASLYPKARAGLVDAMASQAEQVFGQYGISDGVNRLQYFLAQIGHESGGLSITEENLNYSPLRLTQVWPKRFPTLQVAQLYAGNPEKLANYVYANRNGNGPPESGDGWLFRGRGLIQITGRDAYQNLGKATGIDLLNQPGLANDPSNALIVACGFWKWKKLNPLCDKGDFNQVTKLINGGFNGLPDRMAWLDKVRRIISTPPQLPNADAPDVVIPVQQALRAKGYTEVGAADGVVGPRTKAAIRHYCQKTGLPDGDAIDLTLLQALGVTL
ncbi:MAG: glycoside hydrolase family 19 protein [Magnetococcales bacterium]|nr:glycoside hydrolase family 19 protein [Magnetococcales bacterium]NGZ25756.1 glycoside hydrolase family 19 protein [Magnetococcales bacterium]